MALREQCTPEQLEIIEQTLTTGSVTKGAAAIVNDVYGFYIDSKTYSATDTTEKANVALLVFSGTKVEVDAEALTYNAGDFVYDDDTTPTGVLNKTSGAGRRRVGVVLEKKVLSAQGKILIKLIGLV